MAIILTAVLNGDIIFTSKVVISRKFTGIHALQQTIIFDTVNPRLTGLRLAVFSIYLAHFLSPKLIHSCNSFQRSFLVTAVALVCTLHFATTDGQWMYKPKVLKFTGILNKVKQFWVLLAILDIIWACCNYSKIAIFEKSSRMFVAGVCLPLWRGIKTTRGVNVPNNHCHGGRIYNVLGAEVERVKKCTFLRWPLRATADEVNDRLFLLSVHWYNSIDYQVNNWYSIDIV